MTLPVRLLPEARAEFDEAAGWSEQRRPGLGAEFIESIRKVPERIATDPRRHPAGYQDVKKSAVKRSPFVVLYREEPGEVLVVAIFHTSRDPSVWRSRS